MVAKEQVDTSHDMSAHGGASRQQLTSAAHGVFPDMIMFRSVTDWSRWDKAVLKALDIMGAPNILSSGPVPKKTGEGVPPRPARLAACGPTRDRAAPMHRVVA